MTAFMNNRGTQPQQAIQTPSSGIPVLKINAVRTSLEEIQMRARINALAKAITDDTRTVPLRAGQDTPKWVNRSSVAPGQVVASDLAVVMACLDRVRDDLRYRPGDGMLLVRRATLEEKQARLEDQLGGVRVVRSDPRSSIFKALVPAIEFNRFEMVAPEKFGVLVPEDVWHAIKTWRTTDNTNPTREPGDHSIFQYRREMLELRYGKADIAKYLREAITRGRTEV